MLDQSVRDFAVPQSIEIQDLARSLVRLRQEQARHFRPIDTSAPAWDLMLVLFARESGGKPLCLGELCEKAGIARTTGLRWLHRLIDKHYVTLSDDTEDRRAVRVEITDCGRDLMVRIMSATRNGGA